MTGQRKRARGWRRMSRLARMLKALGNPIRFQIIKTLAERRTCITHEIVATTPLAQSTVSQHLKVLWKLA